jgi:hypothetical protein
MGFFENGCDLWKEEEVARSAIRRIKEGRRASTDMFLLAKNCLTDKSLWDGALS